MSKSDLRSRSGGTDGRPVDAYILSNRGESFRSASSAIRLTTRSGCSWGTSDSIVTTQNIEGCPIGSPRMIFFDHACAGLSIPFRLRYATFLDPVPTTHHALRPREARR